MTDNLPPLPETVYGLFYEAQASDDDEGYQELVDEPAYTAAQMQAYARAALAQAQSCVPAGWEHLKAFGYAPGAYINVCVACKHVSDFVDKRAYVCRPCAEAAYAAALLATSPQPVQPSTRMWHERIKDAHPTSEPQYWPNPLKVEYMEQEILDLRALVAQAKPEQAAQPHTCGLTECQGRARCRPCIAMGMNAAPQPKD